MKRFFQKNKKIILFASMLMLGYFSFSVCGVRGDSEKADLNVNDKKIRLIDEGFAFDVFTEAENVQTFLTQQNIKLTEQDAVYPARDEKIYAGTQIIIQRAKKIRVKEGGNTKEFYTLQKTVEQAIWENENISLSEDDITKPERTVLVENGMTITVTHVVIREEIKNEEIAFKTITNEDDDLSWRVKKVTQKGEQGVREVKYRIVLHDGKEISRKILAKEVIKNPVDEIVTQGTQVKVGKVHTGVASWYAWTGTLAAANPWLPMGSYVRVTNTENGKSVIVKINDRGPFGNGRIIDLDKVAFAQIASVGAGVVNVKMEVITN